MRRKSVLRLLLIVGVAFALACGRSVRTSGSLGSSAGGGVTGSGGSSGHTSGSGRGGEAARGGGGGGPAGDGGTGAEPACESEAPPEIAIRRLSRFEYDNTVRELLDDSSRPARTLPFDGIADSGSPEETPVSTELVEGYHELAHDFAARVSADGDTAASFMGCDPRTEPAEPCVATFIEAFVSRTFRRPASAAELAEFASVFAAGEELGGDFRYGARAVVEVALQAPEFLYRPEFGEPADDRPAPWARPAPYEMASRLSYLFWGGPPDSELLDAAARGELRSVAQVEAQATRLLENPQARAMVGHFYSRFLHVLDADFPAVNRPEYPSFTPEIAQLMREETAYFSAELTLGERGDFEALLTASHSFLNEPLAAFYGVSGVTGNEFRRVDLDPARRAGLLTQPSFLAMAANGPFSDPNRRGAVVARMLLCQEFPFHPPGSDLPIEPLPAGMTSRERVEASTSDPSCAGCHGYLHGLGFAFEHYDGAGLWRDAENSLPIDASGEIQESDAAGPIDGARELAERLAASSEVKHCFIDGWFAFAFGRAATAADACTLAALERDFADNRHELKSLLLALARTEAFLYRQEGAP